MRNQLRLVVLLGAASLVASASLLVACSDDTSVDPSTTDGGGRTDGPVGAEGGGGTDSGSDTSPPFDGGFRVDTFDKVLSTEICNSLARCCYGTANPAPDGGADGGSFDRTSCENIYGRIGLEGSNASSEARDGGKVVLDQTAADSCVAKVKAMSCSLSGAEFKAIRAACFNAYSGNGGAGATCTASIECQKGFFCRTVDGGPGACEAVRGVDAGCGDVDEDRADHACSYRGGGDTGNYCKFYDYSGAGTTLPTSQWRCTRAATTGKCASSLWCDQTICNNDSDCVTPDKYFDPACNVFLQ